MKSIIHANQKKLIQQLMGNDSFASSSVQYRQPAPDLTSFKVCKSFLVGVCPHDLFVGTKQDLGNCPKLHLEKQKIEYDIRTKKGEVFPDFEYEYYMDLKTYISDIDRAIENANRKSEHTPEERAQIAEVTKDLETLDTEIGLMQQEIEYLMSENKTMMVLQQSKKLSDLTEERKKLGEKARIVIETTGQSAQQKLQPCEQCGAFLSRLDSDRRLADHFIGKIHLGYVHMRSEYKKLYNKYNS